MIALTPASFKLFGNSLLSIPSFKSFSNGDDEPLNRLLVYLEESYFFSSLF